MMKVLVLNIGSKHGENVSRDVLYGLWCKGKRVGMQEYPPLHMLLIYTMLKQNEFDAEFIDAQGEKLDHKQLIEMLEGKKFDAIISQTSTMTFKDDTELLSRAKKLTGAETILIGSHVTFMPENSLKNNAVDFIVKFEPEETILKLVKALAGNKQFDKIKGIGFRKGKKAIINMDAEPPELDSEPIADRTPILGFKYYHPLVKNEKWTTMEASRGCPSRCTYCTAPNFYGKQVRARSIGQVIEEMEYLKRLGYKEIYFRDEVFSFDKKRTIELCNEMISRKLKMKWICNGKIGLTDREMMALMKKAGCHLIQFGVESGSQEILNNIRKGFTVEMARKTFKWAKEAGLKTHAHFMLGCPGETRETIEQTLKLSKELDPDTVAFNIFSVYPGTDFYFMVKDKLPKNWSGVEADLSKLHLKSFTSHLYTSLSRNEVEDYFIKAYREFYTRPKYILKRVLSISNPLEFWNNLKSGIGVFSLVISRKNE
jgi:radical SAM superfamily enzyme YgiQ (UPF0313 family)